MKDDKPRRKFLGQCSTMLGMLACGGANIRASGSPREFSRVLLVDERDEPLDAGRLEPRTEYLFHYPFVTTPCFLIDFAEELPGGEELATEHGDAYRWEGGVGPRRSIVAFSAICAHKLSYPTPSASFIAYRPGEVGFLDKDLRLSRRSDVIQCCSEQSVYDPARGARVLGGPAPQPLAAISLEYGDDHRLYATGVYGGALFERYFERFSHRLVLDYETFDVKARVDGTTRVMPSNRFTRNVVSCG